jgi:rhodanese-related sulfurtransferase
MKTKTITAIVVGTIFVCVMGWVIALRIQESERTMTPGEVESLMGSDSTAVLLDVRTPQEWGSETGHLKGAFLIPLQDLEQRIGELDLYRHRTIITYCRTGNRSSRAAGILNGRGFTAFNMVGGIVRWKAEHRAIEKENQP